MLAYYKTSFYLFIGTDTYFDWSIGTSTYSITKSKQIATKGLSLVFMKFATGSGLIN